MHWNLPEAWSSKVEEYIIFYKHELAEAEKARLEEISRRKTSDEKRKKHNEKSSKALQSTRLVQGAGVVPIGRKREMLAIMANSMGVISGVVSFGLAASAMCTILLMVLC